MSRISTKVNLAMLQHVIMKKKNKEGKEIDVLVIPIELNNLFKSDKGNVYLDLVGFDINNPREGSKDTHIVKQSLPKEKFEAMSEEEKQAMPILGNHIVWSGGGEQTPNTPTQEAIPETDDLPF